jgi:hypothetical protein
MSVHLSMSDLEAVAYGARESGRHVDGCRACGESLRAFAGEREVLSRALAPERRRRARPSLAVSAAAAAVMLVAVLVAALCVRTETVPETPTRAVANEDARRVDPPAAAPRVVINLPPPVPAIESEPAPADTSPPSKRSVAHPYFPLIEGARWTFRRAGGHTRVLTVEIVTEDGRRMFEGVGEEENDVWWSLTVEPDGSLAGTLPMAVPIAIPNPLRTGEVRDYRGVRVEVAAAEETVVVRAGKFQCLRVESNAGPFGRAVVWLARDVGPVRVQSSSRFEAEDVDWELEARDCKTPARSATRFWSGYGSAVQWGTVLTDAEAWRAAWAQAGSRDALPDVDFTKHVVVAWGGGRVMVSRWKTALVDVGEHDDHVRVRLSSRLAGPGTSEPEWCFVAIPRTGKRVLLVHWTHFGGGAMGSAITWLK